jgi:selenide,water dikinase
MRHLPTVTSQNLLVGTETGDDAAVYRLTDAIALVQTVDFFPPIVDDPYHFGAIAVANAVSDIYSMGATPLLGLNLVGFPVELPKDILVSILKGGYDKAAEAGLLIVGGHTVDDKEPKYGLAVTGLIRPGEQVTNAGAKVGDKLVLTKPIGTGIITTAAKDGVVDGKVLDWAVAMMETLNDRAAGAMMHVGVNSCTDVTGFGLLGHLKAMMFGSGTAARVSWSAVPLLDGAWDLAQRGVAPGGTHRNLGSLGDAVSWDDSLPEEVKVVLSDAQTSGGLLLSVAEDRLASLTQELESHGVTTVAVVGEVVEGEAGTIHVLP